MLRLLAENPHPNIAEAIEVDYPEGIYLRNYRQASELGPIYQSDRILWYQNILRALLHLHELGFAHSEIQPHAILFDANGYALLSDFSASRPFEHPNPSLPVLTNGASETVSDATDRFAMASMVYEMETGSRPKIRVDRVKGLILPEIQTGNDGLDSLIENAWRGLFSSTQAMLDHAERLGDLRNDRKSAADLVSKTELQRQLSSWRNNRIKEHGRILFSWMTDREAHIKFLQSLMSIE